MDARRKGYASQRGESIWSCREIERDRQRNAALRVSGYKSAATAEEALLYQSRARISPAESTGAIAIICEGHSGQGESVVGQLGCGYARSHYLETHGRAGGAGERGRPDDPQLIDHIHSKILDHGTEAVGSLEGQCESCG